MTLRIGVVGAGVIGAGVAQCAAAAGFEVVLVDIARESLERAADSIRVGLRQQMLLNRSRNSVKDVLARLQFELGIEVLSDVSLVVENVTESWVQKREVYRNLDRICGPDTIFGANTSVIPIAKIAGATTRAANVIGIHFMNPVPMKPTVEVIRGHDTSAETIAKVREFLAAMGKDCVIVNDSPGFVANRILMLTINEAVFVLQDGVADATNVDRIFRECFGHKMGPLETADLIGLDTILLSIEGLWESFHDPKFRPCPLLCQLVGAGLLGRKTGQGFYKYEIDTNALAIPERAGAVI